MRKSKLKSTRVAVAVAALALIALGTAVVKGGNAEKYDGSCLLPEGVVFPFFNVKVTPLSGGNVLIDSEKGHFMTTMYRCAFLRRSGLPNE